MNEVVSLNETIECLESLNPMTIFEHIIILSPLSTAESTENARRLERQYKDSVRVILQELPGLGGALRAGFLYATGDYILMMASDLETDPTKVPEILLASSEFPLAIISTSRWNGISSGFNGYGKFKQLLNWFFQKFLRIIFKTSLSDITYGYRLYPSFVIDECAWQRTDFAFLLESILRPLKNGIQVIEVPVVWKKRNEGQSSNSLSQTVKYLLVALQVRFSG
jgi:glycosyltransferase involved in cell wall biosynthesis